jgi:hypothetical protein
MPSEKAHEYLKGKAIAKINSGNIKNQLEGIREFNECLNSKKN